MTTYCPMTTLPEPAGYKSGDAILLVGELFGRGYANGLIEEAKRLGMTLIGTTVGRRDSDGALRPLNADELAEAESLLGGKIINIPLEAGFDMESPNGAPSVAERLKKAKPDEWDKISFEPDFIRQACTLGQERLRKNLQLMLAEVEKLVPPSANILLAHTMAGGIPRARFFMPLLNRVFKGVGDKYLASGPFWESEIGKLCDASFNDVTADTFRHLIELSEPLRNRAAAAGGKICYTAYGYHGTAVLINGEYRWQSYTPYLQGYAKMRLESHAADARKEGINATVFNCPEILTNSSALFLGVELSLYPLLRSVQQLAPLASRGLKERCSRLLADGCTLDQLLERGEQYLANPLILDRLDYNSWPQHSEKEQMEYMLATSAELIGMHRDQKQLVCAELSRLVFRTTGRLILQGSWSSREPVIWLNHDIITRLVAEADHNYLLEEEI